MRPSRVWGVLWVLDLLAGVVTAWGWGVLGAVGIVGLWAVVARRAPEYDCPRCGGYDRTRGVLGRLFGGYRRGCAGARAWLPWRRCRGGQRIRLGTYILAPGLARTLAGPPTW